MKYAFALVTLEFDAEEYPFHRVRRDDSGNWYREVHGVWMEVAYDNAMEAEYLRLVESELCPCLESIEIIGGDDESET